MEHYCQIFQNKIIYESEVRTVVHAFAQCCVPICLPLHFPTLQSDRISWKIVSAKSPQASSGLCIPGVYTNLEEYSEVYVLHMLKQTYDIIAKSS